MNSSEKSAMVTQWLIFSATALLPHLNAVDGYVGDGTGDRNDPCVGESENCVGSGDKGSS